MIEAKIIITVRYDSEASLEDAEADTVFFRSLCTDFYDTAVVHKEKATVEYTVAEVTSLMESKQ